MAKVRLDHFETVRTTVALPADLVKWSQHFIDLGTFPSRNTLIVAALKHFLAELDRQEIDRQFEEMATDDAYRRLNLEISEAFADSDWEALAGVEEGDR